MKRFLVILLLLCLSLTFLGCEPIDEKNGGEFLISKTVKYDHSYEIGSVYLDNTRTYPPLGKGQEDDPVYQNIIMELMDLTPQKLTDEYKADLTKRLELFHYDFHWNPDNSLTIISEGEEMTFGKTTDWPTSPEWVKRIPVPEGIAVREVEDNENSLLISVAMTLEEAKAYAQQLKSAGFTIGAQETTVVGYVYSGSDPDGYSAMVTYTSYFQQIELTAPEDEDDPTDDPEISHELPKTGLIEYLPAFPSGKVESVLDEKDSLTVSLSGISSSDGTSFVKKCKAKFNSYVLSDTESDGMLMYIGLNDRDMTLSVVYFGEMLSVSIAK